MPERGQGQGRERGQDPGRDRGRSDAGTGTEGHILHPLLELTRARLVEFVRDPAAVFWVFGFPVLLAVVLGIAFREAPQGKPAVAVVTGEVEARILDVLQGDASIEIRELSREAAVTALRRGEVDLVIGSGQGGDGRPAVVFRYDPTQPQSHVARLTADAAVQSGLGRVDVVTVEHEHVTEVGSRYIDFLLPGLIGLNLLGSSMWGIGFAVVDLRKRRLLKRFAVTPMRRSHFLLAFMLSRMVFLATEVVLLLLFGWLAFGVGVSGSFVDVAVVSFLGSLCFTGLAMLIAARTESTEVAAGWLNFVMMPMWLLSGAFFSYARFPEIFHPFIRALPLTAFNDALRAIMNDGASLLAMPVEVGVMLAWTVVGFAVALRRFRWQ